MSEFISKTLGITVHFQRTAEEECRKSREDHHFVPMFMVMDLIDTIDGISVLVKSGSASPCYVLLRAAFEIQLGVEWILKEDTQYRQRCLDYEFWHYLKRYIWADTHDPNSTRGKCIAGKLKNDPFAGMLDGPSMNIDVCKVKQVAQEAMNSPRMARTKAEYDRSKVDNWFALWDGPPKVEQLAFRLNRTSLYEGLYRPWSIRVHGFASLERFEIGDQGKAMMQSVRSPDGLHDITGLAVNFAFTTAELLQDFYLKSESKTMLLCTLHDDILKPGYARIDKYRI
jgi:hypothetical protein